MYVHMCRYAHTHIHTRTHTHQDTQVNVILQAGRLNPPAATARSPRGPLGDIAAATTTTNDVGNRPFYQLLTGPYLLDSTNGDPDASNPDRYISNVPSFSGTGATFTYWYRPNCGEGNYCGSCEYQLSLLSLLLSFSLLLLLQL
jgi:hypothetical protein